LSEVRGQIKNHSRSERLFCSEAPPQGSPSVSEVIPEGELCNLTISQGSPSVSEVIPEGELCNLTISQGSPSVSEVIPEGIGKTILLE